VKAPFASLDIGHLYRRVYCGINYRLRTIADGRWAGSCRPTDIGFMMTNLCNARCIHCDIWKNKGREETPTAAEYKNTLRQIRDWLGPVHVFFSGGEAMLRPQTIELVAFGSSIGLFTELLTHGYWDDQSRIEKLAWTNPGRITVSLDGMNATHALIRGRDDFFEKTTRFLDTIARVRREARLNFAIRLKTVIMEQNLHDAHNVAHYAAAHGMEAFYQPVEQNYNTPEDEHWFEHSANWPKNAERAVETVGRLIQLKREGLPIQNSFAQLTSMVPYFRNPDALRLSVQMHEAHEKAALCNALTNLQINPNGDVLACHGMHPIGNIRLAPLQKIWAARPTWWREGCCLERRLSEAEKSGRLISKPAT
jgi:MoaA/NifB/PqqE/SkfB family radical SAM enzyme